MQLNLERCSAIGMFATILLYSTGALAWSKEDSYREAAWQTINFIDYRQTLQITKKDNYYEQNPLLGAHPSRGDVDKYFAASALVHYGISCALPFHYRRSWQWMTIGFSSAIVYRNFQIGLQLNF